MGAGYVIKVGFGEPTEVVISTPNQNHEPGPNAVKAFIAPGTENLLNRARVWARRVKSDGKAATDAAGKEKVLEVADVDYTGKLEFLKWMEQKVGAQQIEIRYLKSSQSLDVEYQDNKQKIRIDPEGKDGSAFVSLDSGENKFDLAKDALLIEFLKVHPQNKNSISKNSDPEIKGFTYYEVTDEQIDKTFIVHSESKLSAGNFVTSVSDNEQSLKNLLELFKFKGVEFGDVNHLSNGLDVYKALLKFADGQPEAFNQGIDEYKKMISDCFVKSDSYKALDLTKNGFVAMITDNKSEIIYEVPEGKGKGMQDWVLQNFLLPEVYEKTKQFKKLCDTKLK